MDEASIVVVPRMCQIDWRLELELLAGVEVAMPTHQRRQEEAGKDLAAEDMTELG